MEYKGKFYFDKDNHPGECQIDNKNNIYLTINESDINGPKKKIVGNAGNEHLVIYNSRLIGNGVGYYKYQSEYLVKGLNIKYRNVDFSKHIQDFRITFSPLDEWLGFSVLKIKEDGIEFDIPDDIILYHTANLEIKIKYYKENFQIETNGIKNIKIVPYVCFQSSQVISIKKMMFLIQLTSRFFATLIGFTGNIHDIKFHYSYRGKKLFEGIENELIINADFSNCFDIRQGYSTLHLRSYYKDFKDINDLFQMWFKLYHKMEYQEAFIYYFNPYKNKTIEDAFLVLMKCLEKISISKEDKKRKKKRNEQLYVIVDDFYKNYGKNLVNELKKNDFKKQYVKNIKDIHDEIANQIVYKYDNRTNLSIRIKDLDGQKKLEKHFQKKHIENLTRDDLNIYDYLTKTRNYFTHLDKKENIISTDYLSGYCRLLEKVLIKSFLSLIINDKDQVGKIMDEDEYLNLYNDRDV